MNGKYLLDTNAIINLLKDENSDFRFSDKKGVFFVSIITEIELLSFNELSKRDETKIKKILPESCVINISTLDLRKNNRIKLPDAVICATAMDNDLTLVTDDKQLFSIQGLNAIHLSELTDIYRPDESEPAETEEETLS